MSSKTKEMGVLADVFRRETLDGTITKLRLDQLKPSGDQPRKDVTRGIDDLARSIQEVGLLQPLVVKKEGEGYRIIAGERRYHALKQLGIAEVDCRIKSGTDLQMDKIAIIENLQREDLTAQEEASALLKLKKQESCTDEDLARMLGKSRNYITEILGIGSLPGHILKECLEAGISSKNLMIQVVQAYKRNEFTAFIQAFKTGTITNVREARDFNRPSGKTPLKKEAAPKGRALEKPSMSVEKNTIKIRFKTEPEARAALKRLERFF